MEQPQIFGLIVFLSQIIIIVDLLKYFVFTWIGPHYVLQQQPIVQEQEDANHGAHVDRWIRGWIQNENLGNRMALFPIQVSLVKAFWQIVLFPLSYGILQYALKMGCVGRITA